MLKKIQQNWIPSILSIKTLEKQGLRDHEIVSGAITFRQTSHEIGSISCDFESLFLDYMLNKSEKNNRLVATNKFPMDFNWEPSDTFISMCEVQGFDIRALKNDAAEVRGEFINYWVTRPDTVRTQTQWDRALLNSFVRRNNKNMTDGFNRSKSKTTRELSLQDELNDTSWAD